MEGTCEELTNAHAARKWGGHIRGRKVGKLAKDVALGAVRLLQAGRPYTLAVVELDAVRGIGLGPTVGPVLTRLDSHRGRCA